MARAGWTGESRIPLEEFGIQRSEDGWHEPGKPYRAVNEYADYVLPDRLRRPLAVLVAKRTSRNPVEGERQAADYAEQIKAQHGVDPFVFLANGNEVWFWHRRLYPPRKVSGFFTCEDLERIAFQDRYHDPLVGLPVSASIINRAYQTEAVKTVAERIANALRHFLLVMDGCPKSGPRPRPRPSHIGPFATVALWSLRRPPQERV